MRSTFTGFCNSIHGLFNNTCKLDSYKKFFAHAVSRICTPNKDIYKPNPNFVPLHELDEGVLVVCIHGLGDGPNAFEPMEEAILSNLDPNKQLGSSISGFLNVGFDKRFTTIDAYAEQTIDKLIARGCKRVAFCGHSRGGLIASRAQARYAEKAGIQVDAVFTMGSPFEGSWLAVWPLTLLSASIIEMQIGSKLLEEIREEALKSGVKYFFYEGTEGDFFVKEGTACVQGKGDVVKVKASHVDMMHNPPMFEDVLAKLNIISEAYRTENPELLKQLPDDLRRYARMISRYMVSLEEANRVWEQVNKEITAEINRLRTQRHIRSPNDKIAVLEALVNLLSIVKDTQLNEFFPGANTVGKLIEAFLYDDRLRPRPIDTLAQPLNEIMGVPLSREKPASQIFAEQLIKKFQHAPLLCINVVPYINELTQKHKGELEKEQEDVTLHELKF